MSRTGHDKERRTRDLLRDDGWIVIRAAGSLGCADLVALKAGERPRLLEIKYGRSAWENFRPADRAELLDVAKRAGAVAELVWWPRRASRPQWVDEASWP